MISGMEKISTDIYSFENLRKGDRRPVTLVGINFRLAKRNIDEPLFAKL